MFNCSAEDIKKYNNECYRVKKQPRPFDKFSYLTFLNVKDGINKINSIFIPAEHGILPKVQWSLLESDQLLIKEIWFYTYEEQYLYQCAVERAWALGGHLDSQVEQYYYD